MNKNLFDEQVKGIEQLLTTFKNYKEQENFDGKLIDEIYLQYEKIVEKCTEAYANIDFDENIDLENQEKLDSINIIDSLLDDAEVYYDILNRKLICYAYAYIDSKADSVNTTTQIIDEKTKKVEDKLDKQQGLQFAIFSMVIGAITFILKNAEILTVKDISIKNILLVNFSFLLAISSLFSFIYVFLGFGDNEKSSKFRKIVLVGIPLLFLVGIIIVYLINF